MTAPAKVRVDYRGMSCHGKTLSVLGERDFHGIPCLILDDDGIRLMLPRNRLIAVPAKTKTTGGSTP